MSSVRFLYHSDFLLSSLFVYFENFISWVKLLNGIKHQARILFETRISQRMIDLEVVLYSLLL